MQKNLYFSLFVLLISIITSCTKKQVKVYYDSTFVKTHTVILDDTLHLKGSHDAFSKLLLNEGNHKLVIDNQPSQDFKITELGGILNLKKEAFVRYEIKYSFEGKKNALSAMGAGPVIIQIDSLLVGKISTFNELLPIVKKTGLSNWVKYVGTNADIFQMPKDSLFISKSWDFDIDEPASETVIQKTRKDYDKLGIHFSESKFKIEKVENFIQLALKKEYGYIAINENIFTD